MRNRKGKQDMSTFTMKSIAGLAIALFIVAALTGCPPSKVNAPDVVGMTQSAAEAAITSAGLTVGTVTEQYSDTVPAGQVISQNPAAGASVAPNSAVALVVSKGPEPVNVPDLVGMTQSAAEAALTSADLVIGGVTEAYNNSPAGNVYSQVPSAGSSAAPGSTVDIAVSLGRNAGIVVNSSLESSLTSATEQIALSGSVIVLDDLPLPGSIEYVASNTGGDTSGSGEVAPDGSWSLTIDLVEGDNRVTLSTAYAVVSETLTITYNPDYQFGGQLAISPDLAYVGEPREMRALIALTDASTDAEGVFLYRVHSADEQQVAQFSDDGNLDNGDEIEGDGIYSCTFTLEEDTAMRAAYRARVETVTGADAWSETFDVRVTEHLTEEQLDTVLSMQEAYQTQLDEAWVTKDRSEIEDTVDAIVADLRGKPDIADVGESASGLGVWMVYTSGIGGVIYVPEPGVKHGAPSTFMQNASPTVGSAAASENFYEHYFKAHTPQHLGLRVAKQEEENKVESNKARVIAAQYWDWGESDDIPKMEEKLRNNSCFEVSYTKYANSGSGSVEHFKNLGDYGVVLISSHGDSFYKGLLNFWQEEFRWNGWFGEVVLHSNMQVTSANRQTYEDDLKSGRLVVWHGSYGIMPSFIRRYSGSFPNSLVYMSICRGAWNSTMAQAFLDKGAGTFLGYDEYVSVAFCEQTGPPLMDTLLTPGNTMADAFTAGETDPYPSASAQHPAEFKLFGASDLSLDVSGLQDGDFESNSISQAWTTSGDARIITQLGTARPTQGTYMGIISTGLGFSESSGSLQQEICLPGNAETVTFDWNFMSHEFMTFVGSEFQDSFTVSLSAANGTDSTDLVNVNVDALADSVSPISIDLDGSEAEYAAGGGEFGDDGAYATGWQNATVVIPEALRGSRVTLRFYATDVGDSLFDTAVLIDNIEIAGSP